MAQFDFVDAIRHKYLKEEVELEDKLKAVREKYSTSEDKESAKNSKVDSQSRRAAKRNKALLKELELAAGRARVRSCYSPTESHLEAAKQRYEQALAEISLADQRVASMIRIKETAPPLDFSFRGVDSVEQVAQQRPRRGVKRYRRGSSGRYGCTSLRLNNNHLTSVHGIHAVAYQLLEQPELLTWLDLSFNRLTTLAPEIASFSSLKILYLHGNQLSDLSTVLRPLKCLDELYSLTLHGNPVEERKGYRDRVLENLPQLKSLDFSNVTAADTRRVQARRSATSAADMRRTQDRVKSTF